MGTSKRFVMKFGITACLLAILFCEGFLLYCHYVKHVDAMQYASEKLRTIQKWIDGDHTQTANAQVNDTRKSPDKNSVIQNPCLSISAKDAIEQMLRHKNVVLSNTEAAAEPVYPEHNYMNTDQEENQESESSAAPKAESMGKDSSAGRKSRPVPAESADPSGMEITNINDLLERQREDGLTENPDSRIQLEAEPILQNPELPTGCEITALTMALHYQGYHVSKEKLADQYLEKASPGTVSYKTAFWGDPRKKDSFGCYAPVIVKAANQFLARKKSSCMAYNLTGTPFDDLLVEIRMGCPVILWGSMYINGEIIFSYGWEIDGETVTWPSNEHCMLLTGFDTETNSVIVCDPLAGVTSYDKNAFQHHYETLEQQAIVIY